MAEIVPNSQYNLAEPDSLTMKVVEAARRRMYEAFLRETGIAAHETLLDVGVTSDRTYASSNYLVAWYPHKDRITAVGLDDAVFLETAYPGVKFLKADGRDMPFADAHYDVVHSSAVLEHVGSEEQQVKFLSELCRVARRAVFFTTPDRAFPIEVHSLLPFVHWLPKKVFRGLLGGTGYRFFGQEENLNLLWQADVRRLVRQVAPGGGKIWSMRTWGWPSNILCVILKEPAAGG